jgi:predicted MFS family arabinose efflux permease
MPSPTWPQHGSSAPCARRSRQRSEEASASASERGVLAAVGRTAAELTEGLRFTLGNPVLRALLASSITFNVFGGFFAALFVIFATRELGLAPVASGAVLAVQGVGGVLGALLVGRIVGRLGQGPVLVLAGAGQGVGWLVLPAAGAFGLPAAPTLALALAVSGFSFVAYVVGAVSLRQELTPDGLLGRVNAGSVSLILAAVPAGSLAGGLLATGVGTRTALTLGALLGASGFLWTLFSPVRRLGGAGR